jgi:hypothetical protein
LAYKNIIAVLCSLYKYIERLEETTAQKGAGGFFRAVISPYGNINSGEQARPKVEGLILALLHCIAIKSETKNLRSLSQ